MTERTRALLQHVLGERAGGARVRMLLPLSRQSHRRTQGEPDEIRRAMAQAHVLDSAQPALLPGELLLGSPMGGCPPDRAAPDYAHLRKAGERILQALHASPQAEPPTRSSLTERTDSAQGAPFADRQRLARELSLAHSGKDLAPGALQAALLRGLSQGRAGGAHSPEDALNQPMRRFAPDFQTVLNVGFRGLDAIAQQGLKAARTPEQAQFFRAQRIVLGASQRFILRTANAAAGEAHRQGGLRGAELGAMAQTLRKLSQERADTFYEGVQLILLILVMANLLGCESVAIGRLDQLLGARYDEDIRAGDITEQDAHELLCCLLIKLNEPGHLGTCAITLGGTGADGEDCANALTALCLQAVRDAGLPHPAVAVRVARSSPDWLREAAADCASAGIGQPIWLNDEVWIGRLIRSGLPGSAARDHCLIDGGLIGVPGACWGLMEARALALPDCVSRALRHQPAPPTYDALRDAVHAELSQEAAGIWLDAHERAREMERSARDPFASMLTAGCAASGLDALAGGAALGRPWFVPIVGLATAADALSAAGKWVYEKGVVSPSALADAEREGFSGRDQLLRLLRLSPRYGNGIPEADAVAGALLAAASDAVAALGSGPDRFLPALWDNGAHAALGERLHATCDGRRRGEPLSSGAEPHPGRDEGGLEALIRSAAALAAERLAGGFSLTLALKPGALSGDCALALAGRCLGAALPAFRLCCQDQEALLSARDAAERNLVACAGGVCEWFCELDAALQDGLLRRTVHAP